MVDRGIGWEEWPGEGQRRQSWWSADVLVLFFVVQLSHDNAVFTDAARSNSEE
jgi:hypothetical protein